MLAHGSPPDEAAGAVAAAGAGAGTGVGAGFAAGPGDTADGGVADDMLRPAGLWTMYPERSGAGLGGSESVTEYPTGPSRLRGSSIWKSS